MTATDFLNSTKTLNAFHTLQTAGSNSHWFSIHIIPIRETLSNYKNCYTLKRQYHMEYLSIFALQVIENDETNDVSNTGNTLSDMNK
jgi:hypothetical protein